MYPERFFGEEVRSGEIRSRKRSSTSGRTGTRVSTNRKVWAAKFTRHPKRVALEMSSHECGRDAPAYGVIEGIGEKCGTACFCFKDLDENRLSAPGPGASGPGTK